jgi:hypothetical protein
MAGDIGWQSLELQIEAIIPGILIVFEAEPLAPKWFGNWTTISTKMPTSEFAQIALFVAVAYSVGLLSSLLSRALVDTISQCGPRKLVFSMFAHKSLNKAKKECLENDPQFKSEEQDMAKGYWYTVALWNAIYRSALRRTTRLDEVDRRRSQGRVVRNLLFPAIGAPLILLLMPWSILFAIVSVPLIVFLYAYAEYVNFAEAYDISMAEPKKANNRRLSN